MSYLKDSLDKHRKMEFKEDIAADLGNLGVIYYDKGDLKIAEDYLKEALEIYRQLENIEGEANQLCNLGLIYKENGKLKKALKFHEKALKIFKKINNELVKGRFMAQGHLKSFPGFV